MDKYSRFYGLIIFLLVFLLVSWQTIVRINNLMSDLETSNKSLEKTTKTLEDEKRKKQNIIAKLNKLKNSNLSVQKKIYAPSDAGLGDDSLFFTLYTDVIEMVHSNSIKIQSMDYKYNPADDPFVKADTAAYFVCDVNMKLVSNYVNLGKLIQDIYQYPYFIKIISVDVKPYTKDKKILLTNMNLRLYSRTAPAEDEDAAADTVE